MARIGSYAALLFAIAMFGMVQSLGGMAFAFQDNNDYTHTHATALTSPDLVCGGHPCAAGELPQHPKTVEPVRAH